MTSVSALSNTSKGTVYILGNSSSLEQVDLSLLRQSGLATIGINRILRCFAPTYLVVADRPVLQEELARLNSAKPKLLAWRMLVGIAARIPGLEVRTWETWGGAYARGWKRGRNPEWVPRWRDGQFWHSGNSGTYSIEAAALMGFRDIRLLGIDLRFDLPRSHFFGQNTWRGQRIRYTPRQIAATVKAFEIVVSGVTRLGYTVTSESCYEGPLDAVLARRACPWQKQPSSSPTP